MPINPLRWAFKCFRPSTTRHGRDVIRPTASRVPGSKFTATYLGDDEDMKAPVGKPMENQAVLTQQMNRAHLLEDHSPSSLGLRHRRPSSLKISEDQDAQVDSPYIGEGKKYLLTIKTLTGKTFTLSVMSSNTVQDVKEMIQFKEGIPPDQHRLVLSGGIQLENIHRTLSYYKINEHSVVYVIVRLRGGGNVGPDGILIEEGSSVNSAQTIPADDLFPGVSPLSPPSSSDYEGLLSPSIFDQDRSIEEEVDESVIDISDSIHHLWPNEVTEDSTERSSVSSEPIIVEDLFGRIEDAISPGPLILNVQSQTEEEEVNEETTEDEINGRVFHFHLEPIVALSKGTQLQANVLAMAADVVVFSVSLEFAVSPGELFLWSSVLPLLLVVLLKKFCFPHIYRFVMEFCKPWQKQLDAAVEALFNVLPPWCSDLLQEQEPIMVCEMMKAALVVVIYMLLPSWIKVNLRFRPEHGVAGAIWLGLREQALGRFHRDSFIIAAARDG
uniref:Ubiquitin-like domain-containing protein n=1 Tax=Leersia perrieri TaxID=77586 RepID=A0A0D9X523_9ORYZ